LKRDELEGKKTIWQSKKEMKKLKERDRKERNKK
jgi:hypothetical protein